MAESVESARKVLNLGQKVKTGRKLKNESPGALNLMVTYLVDHSESHRNDIYRNDHPIRSTSQRFITNQPSFSPFGHSIGLVKFESTRISLFRGSN